MDKARTKKRKLSLLKVLSLIGLGIGIFAHLTNQGNVEATAPSHSLYLGMKPAHSMNYKLGEEHNIEESVQAVAQTRKKTSDLIKKQRAEEAKIASEKEAKKQAEEATAVEVETATETIESNQKASQSTAAQSTKSAVQTATTKSTATVTTQKQAISSSVAAAPKQQAEPKEIQPAPVQEAKPAPKQAPQPAPKPSIGANKIGINGIYRSYSNYGAASTAQYQSGIDAGLIVAGITNFNGNDGQTTYFGGHNPGIMNFMANNIYNGAIVTVTDGSGNEFKYKMIDKVDVDEYGEGVLTSIGKSAISAYAYGTGTESILIHFCNTSNNLMSFWYGIRI